MASKTIMIVDDAAAIRATVSITLKSAGYTVLEARDGQDALQQLATQKAHLIISDINMPGMDGITLLKKLKEQAATRFVPVIMLTTEGAEETKARGKEAGAKAWIVKPFDPARLLDAVKKLVLP